ncbi:hypothetical protein K504DRAFT_223871 [Pleomassaria siparia CBS 279.74]|uniref:Carbohydrate kinase PfkB domain-containing protein n=1 Tax=Pleomassaria siparia CBS 279.74 TaxID=1314801 RepID=A0A6G1KGM6_9PLEO|nr:hypothetical protein K504DRAFT_223871 [Pleomassaria siparia CBS 279.74]
MRLLAGALARPRLSFHSSLLQSSAGRRRITNNGFFRVSEEVREALAAKKPVVALETTIYTHGFPYPDNVALASLLESVIRVNGGVPATIGILDGVARVGMSPEELIKLTESAGQKTTLKLSRRDLSYVCGGRLAGKNYHGGTTISGTMILAELAGIKVFGTGGLGGVHRGAESSMDISADLTELGRTPVAVISSGSKSFLDIPRTLEYLETEGVGVGTFADGRTGSVDFPAFWSRDSGVKSPKTIQNEIEAAAIIHAQHSLQIKSGLLFANPIPLENEIPRSEMDPLIAEAIRQADALGASGNDNTPFILAKIKELSGGKTIPANRKLIESNVRRATIIARELAILEAQQAEAQGHVSSNFTPIISSPTSSAEERLRNTSLAGISSGPTVQPTITSQPEPPIEILVAGALAVDFSCDYTPLLGSSDKTDPSPHTSNPAIIRQTLGGVAHNIAKAAHLVGSPVRLCSAIGDDLSGRAALHALESSGMQTSGITVLPNHRTAQYVAVNNANKDLTMAMADMSILETGTCSSIQDTWLTPLSKLPRPKCVIVDGNWSSPVLHTWLTYARSIEALSIFEPVSTAKSTRLFESIPPPTDTPSFQTASSSSSSSSSTKDDQLPPITPPLVSLATPNTHELTALHSYATNHSLFSTPSWFRTIDALGIPSSGLRVPLSMTTTPAIVDAGIPQMAIKLLPFIPTILTKLGPAGVLVVKLLRPDAPELCASEHRKYVLARCTNGDADAGVGGLYVRLIETERVLSGDEVVSVNGIGDTFAGVLAAVLSKGKALEEAVDLAQRAAGLSLQSVEAVSKNVAGLKGLVQR